MTIFPNSKKASFSQEFDTSGSSQFFMLSALLSNTTISITHTWSVVLYPATQEAEDIPNEIQKYFYGDFHLQQKAVSCNVI